MSKYANAGRKLGYANAERPQGRGYANDPGFHPYANEEPRHPGPWLCKLVVAVGGVMQMRAAPGEAKDMQLAGCGRGHADEGRARDHAHKYANVTARASGYANAGLGGVAMQMRKNHGEPRICKWRAVGGDMQITLGLVIMDMQSVCK